MNDQRFESLRTKLDQHYAWPSLYIFKFIVPAQKQEDLRRLFPRHVTTTVKHSEKGNYVSLTYQMMMPSSQSVIEVYMRVSGIEGLVAL